VPIVILVGPWVPYLFVFMSLLFIAGGLGMFLQLPYRPEVYRDSDVGLGVFLTVTGSVCLLIGLSSFPGFRKRTMNLLRPMPLRRCPLCHCMGTVVFTDKHRTTARCRFCNAEWTFHYGHPFRRKAKWLMLRGTDRPDAPGITRQKVPLNHWMGMIDRYEQEEKNLSSKFLTG